jgi:hypothetical protein
VHAAGFFGAILCGLLALLWAFELDPGQSLARQRKFIFDDFEWDRYLVDDLFWLVCGLATVGFAVYLIARKKLASRRHQVRRVGMLGLAGLVLAGSFVYFYGHRGIITPGYPVLYDDFHYYTGPKYYEEFGYFRFYDCVVEADAQGKRTIKPDKKVRDLEDYSYITAAESQRRFDCEKEFSPARWREFRKDLHFFVRRTSRAFLGIALADRGYNGTPFHTFVAGSIANTGAASHEFLLGAALIDVCALLLMMVLVVRSFGWKLGLLFALFFFTNWVDRYWFIGGGFCRYLWMASLGCGLAMLNERRHFVAGILIAGSAMLNAFPVLFLAGIGVKVVLGLVRKKGISGEHRRFVAGVGLATVLFGGLSISHGEGWRNYEGFFQNMGGHSELITMSRIGFKYDFLYRGEVYEEEATYPISDKVRELRQMAPLVYGLGIAFVGLAAWAGSRLDDTKATILVGYSAFFFLFGTVEYYFAAGAIVMLLWHGGPRGPPRAWLIWLPFPLMFLVHWGWHVSRYVGFANNTVMSMGLTVYLVAVIGYFSWKTGVLGELKGKFVRPRAN